MRVINGTSNKIIMVNNHITKIGGGRIKTLICGNIIQIDRTSIQGNFKVIRTQTNKYNTIRSIEGQREIDLEIIDLIKIK